MNERGATRQKSLAAVDWKGNARAKPLRKGKPVGRMAARSLMRANLVPSSPPFGLDAGGVCGDFRRDFCPIQKTHKQFRPTNNKPFKHTQFTYISPAGGGHTTTRATIPLSSRRCFWRRRRSITSFILFATREAPKR